MGAAKNYVFLGLVNAYLTQSGARTKEQEAVQSLIGKACGSGTNTIDPAKIRNLHEFVAHAQITVVQKAGKAYVNLRVRDTHAALREVMYAALDAEGQRQLDPPPLKPRTRELKAKLTETRGR